MKAPWQLTLIRWLMIPVRAVAWIIGKLIGDKNGRHASQHDDRDIHS